MTACSTAAASSGGRRAAVWLIHVYQVARAGHVSPCRFTPTCSEYAVQAVSAHGVRRGISLSARRLTRCRPGGTFGYDPVPPGPFSSPPRAPDLGGNRPLVPADASSEPPVPE
jgi:putative membrane protein insertion efficiency factor